MILNLNLIELLMFGSDFEVYIICLVEILKL